MANIFPEDPVFRTNGERDVLNTLKNCLDDSWDVYYEALIEDVRPDIIIYSEKFGVLILEIKDYKRDTILYMSPDRWTIRLGAEQKNVSSPLMQASDYAYKLIKILSKDKKLLHDVGKYKGNLIFPVVYGCIFPNLLLDDIELMGIYNVIPKNMILTKDDLYSEQFEKKLVCLLHSKFKITESNQYTRSIIRQILYPKLQVTKKDEWEEIKETFNKHVKTFSDFVDEYLFVAQEVRHLHKTKGIPYNQILIVHPFKTDDMIRRMCLILTDMKVPVKSSLENGVEIVCFDEYRIEQVPDYQVEFFTNSSMYEDKNLAPVGKVSRYYSTH